MFRNLALFLTIGMIAVLCNCSPKTETKTEKVYVDRVVDHYIDRFVDRIEYRDITVSKSENDRLELFGTTWEWKESFGSGYLEISGKARNLGTVAITYAKIYTKAYSADSTFISDDYTYLSNTNLVPNTESSWSLTDFDCKTKPSRISIGYSYSAEIIVPAAKGILNP